MELQLLEGETRRAAGAEGCTERCLHLSSPFQSSLHVIATAKSIKTHHMSKLFHILYILPGNGPHPRGCLVSQHGLMAVTVECCNQLLQDGISVFLQELEGKTHPTILIIGSWCENTSQVFLKPTELNIQMQNVSGLPRLAGENGDFTSKAGLNCHQIPLWVLLLLSECRRKQA